MEKAEVAVATITWARDKEEENLLRHALPHLAATGLKVFITDGGSPPAFLEFLNSFPTFTVMQPTEKGLWAQVKNSLFHARDAGNPFLLYTEPDKLEFFKNHLATFLNDVDYTASTGVWLAARSPQGFSSFPEFQRMTETTINNCCSAITGMKEDYTYGPFIMNSNMIPYLTEVKADIGWGWRPYVFCAAHLLGYTINSHQGDFYCPESQRNDDYKERLYRMKQLKENIHGILLSSAITPRQPNG